MTEYEVRLAPFVLIRAAGLPFGCLLHLVPERCTLWIEEALTAERKMTAIASNGLANHLHAAVPSLERSHRGVALEMKRAVFNSRKPRLSAHAEDVVTARIATPVLLDWRKWREAQTRYDRSLARAEEVLLSETRDSVRPRLHELGRSELLGKGIALASLDFADALDKFLASSPPTRARTTKEERTLLAYVTRAAAKTSPFGTFMHVGISQLTVDGVCEFADLGSVERSSRAYLNRGHATALHEELWTNCRQHGDLRLRRNPTLRVLGDGRVEYLGYHRGIQQTHAWRQERFFRVRMHQRVIEGLFALPPNFWWMDLFDRLVGSGLTSDEAGRLAERLVGTAMLEFDSELDAFSRNVFGSMQAILAKHDCPNASLLRGTLCSIEDLVGRWPELSAVERRRGRRALPARSGAVPAVLQEDGFFAAPFGSVGGPLTSLLEEVGRVVRPMLCFKPGYLLMRDLFLQSYGPDGVCSDVLEFLLRVDREIPAERLVAEYAGRTPERLRPHQRAGVSVLLQAGWSCERQMFVVLNQIHGGIGWLSARYGGDTFETERSITENLRKWLLNQQPIEYVDIPFCGDTHSLQAHPRVTRRVLRWPTEPLRQTDNILELHRSKLTYAQSTGTLELLDETGKPVVAVCLGAVIPTPAWGPAYWLTVVGAPHEMHRTPWRHMAPEDGNGDVDIRPRVSVGRVVVERASWRVRSDYLRQRWFLREGAWRLLDVERDRRRLGLPTAVFARPLGDSNRLDADVRKPQWVDLRSPFCLELLEATSLRAEWVALVEALPEGGASWPNVGEAGTVTELLVEMVV